MTAPLFDLLGSISMRALLVHAHPESRSFSASMARASAQVLREEGHDVDIGDLYAIRFCPIWFYGGAQHGDPLRKTARRGTL